MRSIYVCSSFSLSCCFYLMYTIDPSDIRTSLISGQQHWMPRCVIMSMEDLLPKEVDSSNQLPACLKMLFLAKIRVVMFPQTLTPVSYATKITSSLAFKQLVECVGIFCNCSKHLLAFSSSFWKTPTGFRMSWTLSCLFQGAEERCLSNRLEVPILHQKWDMKFTALQAPRLETVYDILWYPYLHFLMSQVTGVWFDHQIIVVKRRR